LGELFRVAEYEPGMAGQDLDPVRGADQGLGIAEQDEKGGTLLPILRDNDMLGGQFGRYVFAAGAVGELFPILIIAVFLTRRGHFIALASVALVGVLALALTAVPWLTRHRVVQRIVQEGQDETAQITLRGAMLLLFVLLAVASRFGLDVVLGAMLAGIVLRAWARQSHMDVTSLEHKFDAVGYGIFIPIFFISSGMSLDLKAIARDPLRLLIFFLMLLVVRGLPSLLVYRRALPTRQRVEMTFITATTLPLLIALADIGQQDGVMLPATAAALVGAGVLAVLVYPPHRGDPAPVGAAHTRGRRDPRGRICRRDQPGTRPSGAGRPREPEPGPAGLTGCPPGRRR
jgi:Kef-type K+ transport system membrane component KefB